MGRFVEEERIKAGTFKALGYQNKDIIRKFIIYGFVTSMIGTAIGVAAGHILLPTIIYNSYKERILLAPIELHFYPFKTLLAIVLGLLSTVRPAVTFSLNAKELGSTPERMYEVSSMATPLTVTGLPGPRRPRCHRAGR